PKRPASQVFSPLPFVIYVDSKKRFLPFKEKAIPLLLEIKRRSHTLLFYYISLIFQPFIPPAGARRPFRLPLPDGAFPFPVRDTGDSGKVDKPRLKGGLASFQMAQSPEGASRTP